MSARIPFVKGRRGPVTKEAWRAFVDRPVRKRPRREPGQSDEQFNRARKRHHSALGPIATPPMRRIHRELWSLLAANVDADPPRPGAVIDGEANLGKTTILTNFGRLYELDQRTAMTEADEENYDDFVPVVNISLPSNANITALNRRLAMFYGIPVKYANTDQLSGLICETAERTGTTLVLVDDFHFLKLGRQTHRDVNDHLKDLASSIGATFVFAGVGVEEAGLLRDGLREEEASNSQFQGRYEHHTISPFGLEGEEDRRRWVKVLRASKRNWSCSMRPRTSSLARSPSICTSGRMAISGHCPT